MQRRTLLKNLLGGALLAPALRFPVPGAINGKSAKPAGPPDPTDPANSAKGNLRIAHLTDVHLKDKWDAPNRFRRCLHHVQDQKPDVDLILNGGDIVFDMNKENLDTINAQWALWHSIIKSECNLPINYALGNHDIWWNENDKGQAIYGKEFSMQQIGLTTPHYSFTKKDWKFIVLDSVHLDVDGTWYIGRLGDDQFNWLQDQLQTTSTQTPVCILSHIPILTATNLVEDNIVNKWEMLGGDMHTDNAKIIDLFYQHPNVKLCLSGHIHLRDKVVYNDVTFICNGAVSGAWWEGNKRQTAPGYGLIDLYTDGSFQESYVKY
jgi:3',5'-cyclic-AMP phosphodiesterase